MESNSRSLPPVRRALAALVVAASATAGIVLIRASAHSADGLVGIARALSRDRYLFLWCCAGVPAVFIAYYVISPFIEKWVKRKAELNRL